VGIIVRFPLEQRLIMPLPTPREHDAEIVVLPVVWRSPKQQAPNERPEKGS
jgi:hypothetical protein